MGIINTDQQVGSYRGRAAICGSTPKTAKRVIALAQAGGIVTARRPRVRNYESVADLVAVKITTWRGQISAKRLLPAARAGGCAGSDRNFRHLIAEAKADWHREDHRSRPPAVWAPGEHLVIDYCATHKHPAIKRRGFSSLRHGSSVSPGLQSRATGWTRGARRCRLCAPGGARQPEPRVPTQSPRSRRPPAAPGRC